MVVSSPEREESPPAVADDGARTNGTAAGGGERGTSLLPLPPGASSLVTPAQRDWVLPEANEFFRRIYTRAGGGRPEILAVCSAIAGEGKTTLALGLAVTIAEDFPERRVLVVETDTKRPALAEDFGLPPAPGLIDCLINNEPLELAYRRTLLDNLQVLPIGSSVPNPGRVLRSSAMAMAMDTTRAIHDLVILDTPALLNNSDAVLLTDLADSTVLVVRAGATPVSLVSKALEDLDQSRLRGVVLNDMHSAIPGALRRLFGV